MDSKRRSPARHQIRARAYCQDWRLGDELLEWDLCGNSTFSMVAAMLNEEASTFVRPEPNMRRLEPFDPWDSDTMLQANGTGHVMSPPMLRLSQPESVLLSSYAVRHRRFHISAQSPRWSAPAVLSANI